MQFNDEESPVSRWPSFFRRTSKSASAPQRPAIPIGQRVYAIGDVHGCASELEALLELIAQDNATRPPARHSVILLGDLVNRGPDSARVVQQARDLVASGVGRLLKGNHEELFVRAGYGDRQAARSLIANGGLATLLSFGLTETEIARGNYNDLATLMKSRLPRDVLSFLDSGEDKIAVGDYVFVHAGLRPGVPINEQDSADLRWIRHEFLSSRAAHGAMVVHGHTITDTVDERENRIGIDTGAYHSGVLSAIGLEGIERWFLSTVPKRPEAGGGTLAVPPTLA